MINIKTSLYILDRIVFITGICVMVMVAGVLGQVAATMVGSLIYMVHMITYDLIVSGDTYTTLQGISIAFILFHIDNVLVQSSIELIKYLRQS